MSKTEVGRKILVEANVNDERLSPGFAFVVIFNPAEKFHAAIKKLGLYWLIALLAILIPVFHFVLVPLFLFLGFALAIRSYKCEGRVLHGETHCPHCMSPIKIQPAELSWPLTEICQKCARVVRIEKQESLKDSQAI